jgi:hypothetical protein
MKKYYYLSIATLSVIFITGVSLVFAQSWEAPAGPPPGNNTSPAINVSDLTQTKAGNLWAAHLSAESDVYAGQSILAPNIIESTDNTRILTIDSTGGEFKWREAGPWAIEGLIIPGGYERIIAPPGNPSIANCSPAKKVVGGGCWPAGDNPDVIFYGTGFPNTETSYQCYNPELYDIVAYAICMSGI